MFTLWDHQSRVIKRAQTEPSIYIAHDTGTGKTLSTIEILKDRFEDHAGIVNTLIVCPVGVLQNWERQINKHFHFEPGTCVVLHGPIKDRIETVKQSKGLGRVFITNFEGMINKDLIESFLKFEIDILVIDEAHRTKSHNSKAVKQIQRIADKADFKYLLSGTPILKDEADIFSQFRILDGGQTFGRSFEAFKASYMVDKMAHRKGTMNYWPDWQIRPEAKPIIAERIHKKMDRAIKADCLDLPDRLVEHMVVGLSKQQQKMYNQMEKDWVANIEDNTQETDRVALAQMALHKILRLQQILSGFVVDAEGVEFEITDNPRLQTLKDLVLDISPTNKVVVWCSFKYNYKQIEDILIKQRIPFATLYGATVNKQGEVDRFVNDPDCRVMVANPKAGGTGIDGLQIANTCIYYSKTHSSGDYWQSRDRTYRGGSEAHEKCLEIHLRVPDSVDDLIMKALDTKQDISDFLLNWKFQTL